MNKEKMELFLEGLYETSGIREAWRDYFAPYDGECYYSSDAGLSISIDDDREDIKVYIRGPYLYDEHEIIPQFLAEKNGIKYSSFSYEQGHNPTTLIGRYHSFSLICQMRDFKKAVNKVIEIEKDLIRTLDLYKKTQEEEEKLKEIYILKQAGLL